MVGLVYYLGIMSGFIKVLFYILGILCFLKYLKEK
jgi:hypothetical protein